MYWHEVILPEEMQQEDTDPATSTMGNAVEGKQFVVVQDGTTLQVPIYYDETFSSLPADIQNTP